MSFVISAKQKLVLIDLLRYCFVTGLIVHYFQVRYTGTQNVIVICSFLVYITGTCRVY